MPERFRLVVLGCAASAAALCSCSLLLPEEDGSCVGDDLDCLEDGTGRQCVDGTWVDLGACPLGCSSDARACGVPSNVEAEWLALASDGLDGAALDSPITLDTDSGSITAGSTEVRAAGEGLDDSSGIWYGSLAQPSGEPDLGIFALESLTVPASTTVEVVGSRALVILVSGPAVIEGLIDLVGECPEPGPGAFAGGGVGEAGFGPCGGSVGASDSSRATGGGGGGFFGAGGAGGVSGGLEVGAGGPGICGVSALVPLHGGSGGAGGVGDGDPGAGGGGGGAVQISSAESITIGAEGGINAGGCGGGGADVGSGGGGGSGGAILLEAPTVTVSAGAVLAANGGGGGGGDCA